MLLPCGTNNLPAKLSVRVISARGLPIMDKSNVLRMLSLKYISLMRVMDHDTYSENDAVWTCLLRCQFVGY
ncbi:C2 domain-containing protein [Dirofilaria immitis]